VSVEGESLLSMFMISLKDSYGWVALDIFEADFSGLRFNVIPQLRQTFEFCRPKLQQHPNMLCAECCWDFTQGMGNMDKHFRPNPVFSASSTVSPIVGSIKAQTSKTFSIYTIHIVHKGTVVYKGCCGGKLRLISQDKPKC
jgi:hypothetical protein